MNFKVLCIIPYNGLKEKIESARKHLASCYPNVSLNFTYMHANLSSKRELIARLKEKDFDIILSRGGTVSLIQNNTNRVVIDIGISQYDIVRTLKMISNLKSTAIVSYSTFKNEIQNTLSQLNINIKNITISTKRDITKVLNDLGNEGYSNIICDSGIIIKSPESYSFNSYLIESGDETVLQAVRNCFIILSERSRNLNYHRIFDDAINELATYTLVFDKNDLSAPLFLSLSCKKDNIYPKVKNFWQENNKVFKIKNKYYQIQVVKGSRMIYCLIRYLYTKENADIPEAGIDSASLFYKIAYDKDFLNMIQTYAKNDNLLCLVGEKGLFKLFICSLIAKEREIDPIFMNTYTFHNEKEIIQQINNPNSHFYDSNHILIFRNVSILSPNAQEILFKFIKSTGLYKRSKIIFIQDQSTNIDLKVSFPEDLSIKKFFLKPLKSISRDSFQELVSSFINQYTLKTGRTITGMDDMVLDRINNYAWPGNYKEFFEIINTLLRITEGPLIKEKELETVLNQSNHAYLTSPEKNKTSSLNVIHKGSSLHDMIAEDIQMVLNKNNGNKTKTAEELEISRSTIWRYLK
ncbi:PrpR N-terminal domain-containing protein [Lactobacillus crispatus]|uniref:Sigma-54 factor interaction domain-containing protein n=1 Tax=Lactobacillus crispatus TaxID=47770 RepID=A0A7H9ECS3_9LACO|nr:PrpR N-terminal domain-containing protein [Lactobacillus crispatus]QLL75015.1 hypothetical protein GTO85_03640 [Lactobacillus crispatus]